MKQTVFEKQLNQRLDENQKLAGGGMPGWMAPVNAMLGREVWKVLMFLSFGVTAGWFLVAPLGVMKMVRTVLLVR